MRVGEASSFTACCRSFPDFRSPRAAERRLAARGGGAVRFLASTAPDLGEEPRLKLAREALAVLDHPELAVLFGPSSRGEVEIAGRLGLIRRIDRLAVTPDAILFADYKTD